MILQLKGGVIESPLLRKKRRDVAIEKVLRDKRMKVKKMRQLAKKIRMSNSYVISGQLGVRRSNSVKKHTSTPGQSTTTSCNLVTHSQ